MTHDKQLFTCFKGSPNWLQAQCLNINRRLHHRRCRPLSLLQETSWEQLKLSHLFKYIEWINWINVNLGSVLIYIRVGGYRSCTEPCSLRTMCSSWPRQDMDCAEHHRQAIKEEKKREEKGCEGENRLWKGRRWLENYVYPKTQCIHLGKREEIYK